MVALTGVGTADGLSYTWPATQAGQRDTIQEVGQTIPLPAKAG